MKGMSYKEFDKLPDYIKYRLVCFALGKLNKISNKSYPKQKHIALWSDAMEALEKVEHD